MSHHYGCAPLLTSLFTALVFVLTAYTNACPIDLSICMSACQNMAGADISAIIQYWYSDRVRVETIKLN